MPTIEHAVLWLVLPCDVFRIGWCFSRFFAVRAPTNHVTGSPGNDDGAFSNSVADQAGGGEMQFWWIVSSNKVHSNCSCIFYNINDGILDYTGMFLMFNIIHVFSQLALNNGMDGILTTKQMYYIHCRFFFGVLSALTLRTWGDPPGGHLPHLGQGHCSPGLLCVPACLVHGRPGRASLSRRHW